MGIDPHPALLAAWGIFIRLNHAIDAGLALLELGLHARELSVGPSWKSSLSR